MFAVLKKLNFIMGPKDRISISVYVFLAACVAMVELIALASFIQFFAYMSDRKMENIYIFKLFPKLESFIIMDKVFEVLGLFVVGVFLLRAVLTIGSNFFLQNFLQNKFSELVRKILSNSLDKSVKYHLDRNTNEIVHHIQAHSLHFIQYFFLPLMSSLSEILTIIVLSLFLIWKSSFTTVLVMLVAALLSGFYLVYAKNKVKKMNKDLDELVVKLFSYIRNSVESFIEIRIYGAKPFFMKKISKTLADYKALIIKINLFNQNPKIFFETIIPISLIVIAITIYSRPDNSTAVGSFLILALTLARMAPSFSRISAYISASLSHSRSLDIVYDGLVIQKPTSSEVKQQQVIKTPTSSFSLDSVSFSYSEGKSVLSNINLNFEKGSKIGVVGKSGSGKSTLIYLILGLLKPSSGRILFNGTSIFEDVDAWQKKVAYVPQSICLLDSGIIENVAFGIDESEINLTLAKKALADADLLDINDRLNENSSSGVQLKKKLSGGQLQRLALARAFYKNTEILIIDEGTSSLDAETEHNVNRTIMNKSADKTVIFISHRLSALKECDQIIIMENGKISDIGTYSELEKSSKWFQYINSLS